MESGSLRARVIWAGTGAWRPGAWPECVGPFLVPEGSRGLGGGGSAEAGAECSCARGRRTGPGPGMAGAPAGDKALSQNDRKDSQATVNVLY